MNNIKIIGIGALCFILGVILGYWLVGNSADSFGAIGKNRYPNSGIAARSLKISASPSTATLTDETLTAPNIQVDSGSTITEHSCATKSFDPASFSSSTVASTTLALTGTAVGDIVVASFDSATTTQEWYVKANVMGAASTTVEWIAVPGTSSWNAGLNITTSTLRVCYFGY